MRLLVLAALLLLALAQPGRPQVLPKGDASTLKPWEVKYHPTHPQLLEHIGTAGDLGDSVKDIMAAGEELWRSKSKPQLAFRDLTGKVLGAIRTGLADVPQLSIDELIQKVTAKSIASIADEKAAAASKRESDRIAMAAYLDEQQIRFVAKTNFVEATQPPESYVSVVGDRWLMRRVREGASRLRRRMPCLPTS